MFNEFSDCLIPVNYTIDRVKKDDLKDKSTTLCEGIGYVFSDFNFTRGDDGFTKGNNTNLYVDRLKWFDKKNNYVRGGDRIIINSKTRLYVFELKEIRKSTSKVGLNFVKLVLSFSEYWGVEPNENEC